MGAVVVVVTTLTGTVILVVVGSVRTWRYHHPSPKKATTISTVDQRSATRPPIGRPRALQTLPITADP